MAFRTYSTLAHGIPLDDKKFNDVDTYVAVFSVYNGVVGGPGLQAAAEKAIKRIFHIVYEGPVAFNHFHYERKTPSQKIIIFEKKPCQQEQKPVPNASLMEKIQGVITL